MLTFSLIPSIQNQYDRRKALHQYDPPDLATNNTAMKCNNEPAKAPTGKENKGNVQEVQIQNALASGLLVDVVSAVSTPQKASFTNDDCMLDSPFSILSSDSGARRKITMDIDENNRWGDEDDSDDDLL